MTVEMMSKYFIGSRMTASAHGPWPTDLLTDLARQRNWLRQRRRKRSSTAVYGGNERWRTNERTNERVEEKLLAESNPLTHCSKLDWLLRVVAGRWRIGSAQQAHASRPLGIAQLVPTRLSVSEQLRPQRSVCIDSG